MKRSSPYYALKYRVDCKPSWQRFWETIVAFNSDRVALHYAGECRLQAQGRSEYKVLKRTAKGWVEITKAES